MPVTSKGVIHDVFRDLADGLAAQANDQAAAARGTAPLRPWNVPDDAVDPLDVPGTTAVFDRSEINTNYQQAIADAANPGTIGDVVSLKVQVDYVAIQERAYRARHCTPVRLLGFTASRRAGHGNPKGVFVGGAVRYAQDALKAGTS